MAKVEMEDWRPAPLTSKPLDPPVVWCMGLRFIAADGQTRAHIGLFGSQVAALKEAERWGRRIPGVGITINQFPIHGVAGIELLPPSVED